MYVCVCLSVSNHTHLVCGCVLRANTSGLAVAADTATTTTTSAAALSLLLLPPSGLPVPVHPDEAVVEHSLGAGDGGASLLVGRVLDQRRVRIATKHYLGWRRGGEVRLEKNRPSG